MLNPAKTTTPIRVGNSPHHQIAVVQRHIEENEQRVSAQRDLLNRFQQLGLPTGPVESLLTEYETTLALFRQDLEAMLSEQTLAAI